MPSRKRSRSSKATETSAATSESRELLSGWCCPVCTLCNQMHRRRCQACLTRRPVDVLDSVTAETPVPVASSTPARTNESNKIDSAKENVPCTNSGCSSSTKDTLPGRQKSPRRSARHSEKDATASVCRLRSGAARAAFSNTRSVATWLRRQHTKRKRVSSDSGADANSNSNANDTPGHSQSLADEPCQRVTVRVRLCVEPEQQVVPRPCARLSSPAGIQHANSRRDEQSAGYPSVEAAQSKDDENDVILEAALPKHFFANLGSMVGSEEESNQLKLRDPGGNHSPPVLQPSNSRLLDQTEGADAEASSRHVDLSAETTENTTPEKERMASPCKIDTKTHGDRIGQQTIRFPECEEERIDLDDPPIQRDLSRKATSTAPIPSAHEKEGVSSACKKSANICIHNPEQEKDRSYEGDSPMGDSPLVEIKPGDIVNVTCLSMLAVEPTSTPGNTDHPIHDIDAKMENVAAIVTTTNERSPLIRATLLTNNNNTDGSEIQKSKDIEPPARLDACTDERDRNGVNDCATVELGTCEHYAINDQLIVSANPAATNLVQDCNSPGFVSTTIPADVKSPTHEITGATSQHSFCAKESFGGSLSAPVLSNLLSAELEQEKGRTNSDDSAVFSPSADPNCEEVILSPNVLAATVSERNQDLCDTKNSEKLLRMSLDSLSGEAAQECVPNKCNETLACGGTPHTPSSPKDDHDSAESFFFYTQASQSQEEESTITKIQPGLKDEPKIFRDRHPSKPPAPACWQTSPTHERNNTLCNESHDPKSLSVSNSCEPVFPSDPMPKTVNGTALHDSTLKFDQSTNIHLKGETIIQSKTVSISNAAGSDATKSRSDIPFTKKRTFPSSFSLQRTTTREKVLDTNHAPSGNETSVSFATAGVRRKIEVDEFSLAKARYLFEASSNGDPFTNWNTASETLAIERGVLENPNLPILESQPPEFSAQAVGLKILHSVEIKEASNTEPRDTRCPTKLVFHTAGSKSIVNVSADSLSRAETLWKSGDRAGQCNGSNKPQTPNPFVSVGFATAGTGKSVKVDEDSLAKAQTLFDGSEDAVGQSESKDIPRKPHEAPRAASLQDLPQVSFHTAGSKSIVGVSADSLSRAEALWKSGDRAGQCNGSNKPQTPNPFVSVGFATAGTGKSVEVDEDSLAKAQTLFDGPEDAVGQSESKDIPRKPHEAPRAASLQDLPQVSFHTAGSKSIVDVSADSLSRAEDLWKSGDRAGQCNGSNKPQTPNPFVSVGFATAGTGKDIEVDEDSLAKAQTLLGGPEDAVGQSERKPHGAPRAACLQDLPQVSFHTAGSKSIVDVSTDSLSRVEALWKSGDRAGQCNGSNKPQTPNPFVSVGFATAGTGKDIEVDEDSLAKAQTLLGGPEDAVGQSERKPHGAPRAACLQDLPQVSFHTAGSKSIVDVSTDSLSRVEALWKAQTLLDGSEDAVGKSESKDIPRKPYEDPRAASLQDLPQVSFHTAGSKSIVDVSADSLSRAEALWKSRDRAGQCNGSNKPQTPNPFVSVGFATAGTGKDIEVEEDSLAKAQTLLGGPEDAVGTSESMDIPRKPHEAPRAASLQDLPQVSFHTAGSKSIVDVSAASLSRAEALWKSKVRGGQCNDSNKPQTPNPFVSVGFATAGTGKSVEMDEDSLAKAQTLLDGPEDAVGKSERKPYETSRAECLQDLPQVSSHTAGSKSIVDVSADSLSRAEGLWKSRDRGGQCNGSNMSQTPIPFVSVGFATAGTGKNVEVDEDSLAKAQTLFDSPEDAVGTSESMDIPRMPHEASRAASLQDLPQVSFHTAGSKSIVDVSADSLSRAEDLWKSGDRAGQCNGSNKPQTPNPFVSVGFATAGTGKSVEVDEDSLAKAQTLFDSPEDAVGTSESMDIPRMPHEASRAASLQDLPQVSFHTAGSKSIVDVSADSLSRAEDLWKSGDRAGQCNGSNKPQTPNPFVSVGFATAGTGKDKEVEMDDETANGVGLSFEDAKEAAFTTSTWARNDYKTPKAVGRPQISLKPTRSNSWAVDSPSSRSRACILYSSNCKIVDRNTDDQQIGNDGVTFATADNERKTLDYGESNSNQACGISANTKISDTVARQNGETPCVMPLRLHSRRVSLYSTGSASLKKEIAGSPSKVETTWSAGDMQNPKRSLTTGTSTGEADLRTEMPITASEVPHRMHERTAASASCEPSQIAVKSSWTDSGEIVSIEIETPYCDERRSLRSYQTDTAIGKEIGIERDGSRSTFLSRIESERSCCVHTFEISEQPIHVPKSGVAKEIETQAVGKRIEEHINTPLAVEKLSAVREKNEGYSQTTCVESENTQYNVRDFASQVTISNSHLVRFDGFRPIFLDESSASHASCFGNELDIRKYLVEHGCRNDMLSDNWIYNHRCFVIWKLAAIQSRFSIVSNDYFSFSRVLEELYKRYKQEIRDGRRPVIRKILNRDITAGALMILCVTRFEELPNDDEISDEPKNAQYMVELTDGWYRIRAFVDNFLSEKIRDRTISVGMKLVICNSKLEGGEDGVDPLDPSYSTSRKSTSPFLKICANASRVARWDAKMGLVVSSRDQQLRVHRLSDVIAGGGSIPLINLKVMRRFPTLFLQRDDRSGNGSHIFTESEELDRIEAKDRAQINAVERCEEMFHEEIEQEIDEDAPKSWTKLIDSSSPSEFYESLSKEEKADVDRWKEQRKALVSKEMSKRIKEWTEENQVDEKPTIRFLRLVVCSTCPVGERTALKKEEAHLTVWDPTYDQNDALKEGAVLDVCGLSVKAIRRNGLLQLSANSRTQFVTTGFDENMDQFQTGSQANVLRAQIMSQKMFSCCTPYDVPISIDITGIIFRQGPKARSQYFLIDDSGLYLRIESFSDSDVVVGDSDFEVRVLRDAEVMPFDKREGLGIIRLAKQSSVQVETNSVRARQILKWFKSQRGALHFWRAQQSVLSRAKLFYSPQPASFDSFGYIAGYHVLPSQQLIVAVDCGLDELQKWVFPLGLASVFSSEDRDQGTDQIAFRPREEKVFSCLSSLGILLRSRARLYRFSLDRLESASAEAPDVDYTVTEIVEIECKSLLPLYFPHGSMHGHFECT